MVFTAGNSANPGGRPKKSNIASGMARDHSEKAIKVLAEKLDSTKEEVQIKAAVELLNRGWGKPQEFIELSGDEDNPLEMILRSRAEDKAALEHFANKLKGTPNG